MKEGWRGASMRLRLAAARRERNFPRVPAPADPGVEAISAVRHAELAHATRRGMLRKQCRFARNGAIVGYLLCTSARLPPKSRSWGAPHSTASVPDRRLGR